MFDFISTYPNSTFVFTDFIPGKNLLMAANPKSSAWYFIIGYVTLAIIYTQTTSYGMFIIAMRMLRKYASSFSKQTLQMQRQFLWLLIIQVRDHAIGLSCDSDAHARLSDHLPIANAEVATGDKHDLDWVLFEC
uniref:Ion_trans_2 domain-containing protein n=1 Tax=Panagrellus redivivus TaxID=6233 RepID=A0A7E4VN44_PANRE